MQSAAVPVGVLRHALLEVCEEVGEEAGRA